MALGFDTYEDKRDFLQDGITGTVSKYNFEGIEYPFLMLHASKENPVHKHQLDVLPNMIKNNVLNNISTEKDNGVLIYFTDGNKILRLGKILPRQVKAFLRLFDGNQIDGMLNEKKYLTGDYLYVLSGD